MLQILSFFGFSNSWGAARVLEHFDKITKLMEEGHDVDIVYVDFAKAFDKVDINIVMKKIRTLGITGRLADWIHCFLVHRKQQVIVNSAKSSSQEVMSGVPQGSVLGPLIFLILIGDIDKDIVSSFLSSFADDTRIGQEVDCEQDAVSLQNDLESIYKWCESNNMCFNSDKFEHMEYLHNLNTDTSHKSPYTDNNGNQIKKCDNVKDLGVYMSANGTFKHHISITVSKAKQMCSWILRTFSTRARLPMLILYKSLVLPLVDYCSQLWNPCSVGDINIIETLQKTYINKIEGMHQLTYWQQLQQLKLYSLQRRRERYIIIYLWKMLEGVVPQVGNLKSYTHIRHGRKCRVPCVNTCATSRVRNIRNASFAINAPRLFNSLPKHIRDITDCSTDVFKNRLDNYLSTIADEPQIPGYTAIRRAETNSLLHMQHLRPQY